MIERPTNLEDTLDIIWGVVRNDEDRWRAILPGCLGSTRNKIASETGWPYSTVHRLVEILEKQGQLTCQWNHQHQSYWEGYFSTYKTGKAE